MRKKKHWLLSSINMCVCALHIRLFYAHSHEVNIYIQKRSIQHKMYICGILFLLSFFFLLVHSFDGRLCMYDAFFITRKKKNKTKKCYENKGGIEKKGGNMKEKKHDFASFLHIWNRNWVYGRKKHFWFDKELKICWIYIKTKSNCFHVLHAKMYISYMHICFCWRI